VSPVLQRKEVKEKLLPGELGVSPSSFFTSPKIGGYRGLIIVEIAAASFQNKDI